MRFVKQGVRLKVCDPVEEKKESSGKSLHGVLFGTHRIRALICGPSGSGKTSAVLSLLLHPNGLRYANVYVFSRTLNQGKYEFLQRVLDGLEPGINYFGIGPGDNGEIEFLPPDQIRPNSIVVFDDLGTGDYEIVRQYFAFSRHFSIDVLFCCHSYVSVPKNLIRINLTMILAFKMDLLNLKHIYDDNSIQTDMSFDEFKNMCTTCWKGGGTSNFVLIDRDMPANGGKYRKGFDEYICMNK
ncbi:Poxvirus A32 protein [Nesidiocoris tenuis]|uniref:Poxvirus A32 protein n=1 Tax=Nesidiocoris tenuis TaxID=355587 RepID=A0ABN7AXU6_9HEMI|nr:Poxvirus A32 protein [Nesidiocoris tenuis]BES95686.1 Poxvirus A32 protein [Nesidiocoris tenuis]